MKIEGRSASVSRRTTLSFAAAAALLVALPGVARADWKPTHPINLIVPWAAGGSTDQITRVVAAELEKPLGQTIVIVNQPGASGAIGTGSALEAAKDGYTWTAGAAQDLGAYETLGALKSRITDWNLFLSVANVQVIAVPATSPYKDARAARGDEGETRPDLGRDGGRHLRRSQRDGAHREGDRRQVPARDL
jgi:tripartite-type tricarboxylate transporter receptor subunit TctC